VELCNAGYYCSHADQTCHKELNYEGAHCGHDERACGVRFLLSWRTPYLRFTAGNRCCEHLSKSLTSSILGCLTRVLLACGKEGNVFVFFFHAAWALVSRWIVHQACICRTRCTRRLPDPVCLRNSVVSERRRRLHEPQRCGVRVRSRMPDIFPACGMLCRWTLSAHGMGPLESFCLLVHHCPASTHAVFLYGRLVLSLTLTILCRGHPYRLERGAIARLPVSPSLPTIQTSAVVMFLSHMSCTVK
jgi:hypothetical protein